VPVAACRYTGGVRPRYTALPQSRLLEANREPAPLIRDLSAAVQAAGLAVDRSSPAEGYLETRWFDVSRRISVGPPFDGLDRTVKIRFYADRIQGRTRLLAECVQRIAWDPSLPERELERVVPEGHAGRILLDSLVAPFIADSTRPQAPLP